MPDASAKSLSSTTIYTFKWFKALTDQLIVISSLEIVGYKVHACGFKF